MSARVKVSSNIEVINSIFISKYLFCSLQNQHSQQYNYVKNSIVPQHKKHTVRGQDCFYLAIKNQHGDGTAWDSFNLLVTVLLANGSTLEARRTQDPIR